MGLWDAYAASGVAVQSAEALSTRALGGWSIIGGEPVVGVSCLGRPISVDLTPHRGTKTTGYYDSRLYRGSWFVAYAVRCSVQNLWEQERASARVWTSSKQIGQTKGPSAESDFFDFEDARASRRVDRDGGERV